MMSDFVEAASLDELPVGTGTSMTVAGLQAEVIARMEEEM
jgi:hypothetical protein